jgi:hypothetical protein
MFTQSVLEHFHDSETTPLIVEKDGELDCSSLKRAVVILHATWSGPSVACLRCLASLSVPTTEAWLYVVNIDGVSRKWIERHFGGLAHGRGETLWIRDGSVETRDEAYGLRHDDAAKATGSLFDTRSG